MNHERDILKIRAQFESNGATVSRAEVDALWEILISTAKNEDKAERAMRQYRTPGLR